MLKKVLFLHLFPFLFACSLIWSIIYYIDIHIVADDFKPETKVKLIEGEQLRTSGFYPNLEIGNQAELYFISSIKNKNQLTIFGSSEFTSSPYCSYKFFPDSFGIQSMGFGHAFHQNFCILCELLAANEYVDSSKICILISPGWFETKGTNISAFVEFVRPNFLNRILYDDNIEDEYKFAVGKYINKHIKDLNGVSKSMTDLRYKYMISNSGFFSLDYVKANFHKHLKRIHQKNDIVEVIKYQPKLNYLTAKSWTANKHKILDDLQKEFISNITNNDIYVYDEYYEKYLLNENGKHTDGSISKVNLKNSQELKDFKLLVKYLASRSADCSFVIQTLNPYYYSNLKDNDALVDTLTNILDRNNIPYLNMHASNKKDYEPGTLNDVMHLGDYGWMKINYFLDSLYNEN